MYVRVIWVQATETHSGKFAQVQPPKRTERALNANPKAAVGGTFWRKPCFHWHLRTKQRSCVAKRGCVRLQVGRLGLQGRQVEGVGPQRRTACVRCHEGVTGHPLKLFPNAIGQADITLGGAGAEKGG